MTTPNELVGGQSPIALADCSTDASPAPRFDYTGDAVRAENLPDQSAAAPMLLFEPGNALHLGGERYELLQTHWHTPSEHTLDGERLAMELHLVHQNDAGELLVVGVCYRLGEADSAVERLIAASPPIGEERAGPLAVTAADYAPPDAGYWHYVGSLTGPPYSEPVSWYVSRAVPTVSEEQTSRLRALTGGPNARPLQDVGGRSVVCVG